MAFKKHSVLPGFNLSLGYTILYLGLIVLLPLSALIFNAIIIPLLIPLALRGVTYKPIGASALLRRNLFIYGLGGVIVPFVGIKLIDMLISVLF